MMYKNDAKQPASPDGLPQPDKIGGLSRAIRYSTTYRPICQNIVEVFG